MSRRWPDTLWIVRHGQSAGNVARDLATAAGLSIIDIAERDVDVPLSALGEEQARALGKWYASKPDDERPTTVLCSPYRRAMQTAALMREAGGSGSRCRQHLDERLREREFGVLDRLTSAGIRERFPDQAEARTRIGKFYHRPPGGESWCDVILRLRSVLDSISLHHSSPGSRVLIVAHQVVVLCFRYLIEELNEGEILEVDRVHDVANCGVTEYRRDVSESDAAGAAGADGGDSVDAGRLRLVAYNFVAPLEQEGTPVTASPDAPVAPR